MKIPLSLKLTHLERVRPTKISIFLSLISDHVTNPNKLKWPRIGVGLTKLEFKGTLNHLHKPH